MNVDSSVNIGNGHVNAVVSAGNTSVSADVDVNNRNVQSDVQRRNSSVDAHAQVRSGNVHTEVNPHMSVVNDHSQLQNLDYDHAGHTGFQRQLNSDNAGTGISIETDHVTGEVVISNTQTSAEWGNIEGDITNQTDLNNILTGLDNDITAVESDVDDIQELIPAQATPENQLADKEFVNSSVSTATATYKGNFNVVTDLNLHYDSSHGDIGNALDNTISTADNNDYSFVKIPTSDTTPTEISSVERYKYNGTHWLYEYTLNNSGYTAEQWASINSGITSGKVTQYDGYATSKQDVLTAGTNITILNDVISAQLPPTAYPTVITGELTTGLNVRSNVGDGGSILLENGFVWNMSGNPTTSDNKVLSTLGVGNETGFIPTANTGTYYIKSFAKNANGTTYGQEITKTVGTPITVDTLMEMYMLLPLPSDYRRLDYVQTNGSSFIATHWTYYSTVGQYVNTRCKFQLVEQTANYQAIYGVYGSGENDDCFRLITSTQSSNVLYANSNSKAGSPNTINLVDKYALLEVAQNMRGNAIPGTDPQEYIGDNKILVKSVNENLDIQAIHQVGANITNNFSIGRAGGAVSNLAKIKFYGFYIDSNREYNNIYIPCIRNTGLTPGMYNPTNRIFYATGTFIAGNYIDEPVLLNGQMCYCNETQQNYRYNGTTWVLQS